MNIPIKDAKEMFEDLVRRAEAGEQVVVTRDGRPVAEIVSAPKENSAASESRLLPRVGAFKDQQLWIAPDFDELGPEWGRLHQMTVAYLADTHVILWSWHERQELPANMCRSSHPIHWFMQVL